MSEHYGKRAEAQSTLEQAVRDYIAAAEKYGDTKEEITDQIKDSVLDASDREIKL